MLLESIGKVNTDNGIFSPEGCIFSVGIILKALLSVIVTAVPKVRIELTTPSFSEKCSTTELLRRYGLKFLNRETLFRDDYHYKSKIITRQKQVPYGNKFLSLSSIPGVTSPEFKVSPACLICPAPWLMPLNISITPLKYGSM